MHILFVHRTFPSQFGHLAERLVKTQGWRCSFVQATHPSGRVGSIETIRYQAPPDPAPGQVIPWTRDFERQLMHCHGIYEALKARPDLKPDLVVGHSGFGSTLLVPEVFDCPILNYFEYVLRPRENDMLFRKDLSFPDWYYHWRRANGAMVHLDLETCRGGYSPTRWQRSVFPVAYQPKIEAIFDGIDTNTFRPLPPGPRVIGSTILPENVRIVTYVSRGFEAIRGFDIFMKTAKRIYEQFPNVLFLVAGRDLVAYGPDVQLFGNVSFLKHVLKQDSYDLSKFRFLDWLPTEQLAQLLNLSDLHLYLTTPFPLSWSLFNALACGATVLASDTAPVQELIKHEHNGLLADFFDVERQAELALNVLRAPQDYRHLGKAGTALIREKYSIEAVLPRFVEYFQRQVKGCADAPEKVEE